MLIPAAPDELKNLPVLVDKLTLALEPYVGCIQVTHPGQTKPNNGTGVVVQAPDAPGGVVVLSVAHVAISNDTNTHFEHSILLPWRPRNRDGIHLAKRYRITPFSIHAQPLDLASFRFVDEIPTHKWSRIPKHPPEQAGHSLVFGYATRNADWTPNDHDHDAAIGTTVFLLKTISHGGEISQLELKDIPHNHPDYPGMSGAPVWQFQVTSEGIIPHLAGLIKGLISGQTDITMHSVHGIRPDGKWRFAV